MTGSAVLRQRRIAHPKPRSHMLGDKLNRGPVCDWIALGQILHGLDQQALSVNIPRIGRAHSSFRAEIRSNRDGKNLGHEQFHPISGFPASIAPGRHFSVHILHL